MHFNTDHRRLQSGASLTNRASCISALALLSLCLATGNVSCTTKQAAAANSPAAAPPPVSLTEQDSGKSIEISVGQPILVRLASNPTTGYSWSVQGNPAPLEVVKSDYDPDPQGKSRVGAGGVQTVQLIAKSAGKAQLKLYYRRPWEKDVPPASTFAVTIVVK